MSHQQQGPAPLWRRDKGKGLMCRAEAEVSCWKLDPGSLHPAGDRATEETAAMGGASQTEREGEKLPGFSSPPTLHLKSVAPISQSQLPWEPGKLRLRGSKNP